VINSREDHALDNYLDGYFNAPQFFESVCPAAAAGFGDQLNELVTAISQGKGNEHLNKEWFLQLVEKVIYHEYGNYLSLNDIRSVKLETRKEILRRLKAGRQYMDDEFLSITDINTVAVYCNMSLFHFYRSFKQAFGVSPYQYLLGRRLLLAKEMVYQNKLSLTAIATHCNFPDLFTFSKAFKRKFNSAPSLIHAKK
jgi:AraC-like DNA-binding protein